MKISISQGYIPGEDELILPGYPGPVSWIWSGQQGYLVLVGGASISEYIKAIRMVQYRNNAPSPTVGGRSITFSLDDADYLPYTGHFYRFISRSDISWSSAKAEAESAASKYYGLQGYLATITSEFENIFIQQKTIGVGWIGATDQSAEGEWRWVTGPEGNRDGGKGLLFWRGSGGQAKANPANLGPVMDANGVPYYHNWNRWDTSNPTGDQFHYEPNDTHNVNIDHQEDYAHITFNPSVPSESKKWNDYPDRQGSGYLIEYGGMPGDPVVNLTADISLLVHTVGFVAPENRIFTRCQGDPVTLNRQDTHATYTWTPVTGLSDPTVSNPLARPDVSTSYSVRAVNGSCSEEAKFIVNINPKPVSLLKEVENICEGNKVTLDPGVHNSYLWNTGGQNQKIIVGTNGMYKVRLTAANKCITNDSVNVVVHSYPKMDLSKLDTIFCDTYSARLNISSDKGSYTLTNLTNNQQFNGTNVTVPAYGDYPFSAEITDPYGCPSDTMMTLRFHKIPKVNLTIDETKCYGYNLLATYVGDAAPPSSRFTWIFGGDTISNKIGQNTEQIPLGVNQTKRDLVVKVTEDGCTGSNSRKDILVIPDLKLSVKNPLQCQPVPFEFSATNTETVVKYEWNWGDGSVGSGRNASHIYANGGYYDVNLVVTTDKGCMNSATIEKMVYAAPIPTVGFSISPATCLNQGKDTLNYVGSAGAEDTFHWDLKGFDPVEIIHAPDTTSGPLVFDLINKPKTSLSLFVISKYGCRSPSGTLEVRRKPLFSFTSDIKEGCAPLPVSFTARIDDPVDRLSFQWDFGDGNQGDGSDIDHSFLLPGQQHGILLKASSSVTGCKDSIFSPAYIVVHPIPTAGFSMDHDIVYNDMPKIVFTDQSVDAINYYWDFGDNRYSREKDPEHSYEIVGRRKVIQTVYNQFDCQDTTSRSVLVAFSRLFAPNAIAPGAPEEIDRVFLLSSEGINREGYHLVIFSRWNDIVFECRNEVRGWDGKMKNGIFAPAGNYIWILDFVDFLGRPHRQSGSLTLVY
jgi:PKD repeat protein